MFDAAEVKRLAHLARIAVDDTTAANLGGELDTIMKMVDELKAAEVEGVEPMAHPLALSQRLRADAVTEAPERDLYQQNAPDTVAGVYRVPRVIDRS
ncbi:MAG: Asp-tRNA(Asn)/Glu-tRNA(Gln) amidotransferase subunit GatC [Gammaproteobacteria bacterium]|nr:Asp-tRNA(Asn)/Glu-tRNA(Gln) amidotransferase subunit GatC [Gammaproteobacteria bacterium]